MTGSEWMDLTVLERKKYNYLGEVLDLTQQLAESLERSDQVSARMILAMRQDPILHLGEIDQACQARRRDLTQEDRERAEALLKGAQPRSNEERTFLEQAGRTRRLLERVVELDRRVSLQMAGDNSFYKRKSTAMSVPPAGAGGTDTVTSFCRTSAPPPGEG